MSEVAPDVVAARRLVADGRLDDAARAYQALRERAPAEAAEFLGIYALRQERWADAAAALGEVVQRLPGNDAALENLGIAWLELGELDRAADAFERVLAKHADWFVSRLMLGLVARGRGQVPTAAHHIHWAVRQARRRGFWKDDGTTQPWLRARVRGAIAFAAQYRRDVLSAPLVARPARDPRAYARVEAFIDDLAYARRARSPDPRQAPQTHCFAGLPATPWFDPALFPWAQALREAFPAILEEYRAVASADAGFKPFLDLKTPAQAATYLGTTGAAPAWNAFFFYRHGVRDDDNCRRCPRTAAVIDALPLIRLQGLTPEICFSVLTPGTHILPHRGDSNLRSVVHLGLEVPPDCALNVAGEARGWAPGELLAFDDTYEHEAWNRSGAVRAVLLMDAWNPHLAEAEKAVLPGVLDALHRLGADAERLKPAQL